MKLIPYGHMGKKWFNLEDNAKDIYQNNNIFIMINITSMSIEK